MSEEESIPAPMRGHLWKQSPGAVGRWTWRYIVIENGRLQYWASQAQCQANPNRPKGEIDLGEECELEEQDCGTVTFTKFLLRPSAGTWSRGTFTGGPGGMPRPSEGIWSRGSSMGGPGGRIFRWDAANSEYSRAQWMSAMQRHLLHTRRNSVPPYYTDENSKSADLIRVIDTGRVSDQAQSAKAVQLSAVAPSPEPAKLAVPQASPKVMPKANLKETSAAPKAATPAAPAPTADGEASASQVVGGGWVKPKGPSPDDDKIYAQWKDQGKLFLLQGVWCTVPYRISAIPAKGSTQATEAKAQEIVDDVFQKAKRIFSHFEKDSEISKINSLGVDQLHSLSPEMMQVLSMVAKLNASTRGVFDPAVLPLSTLYRDAKDMTPSPELIEDVKMYSKWSKFKIDDKGLQKVHGEAKLDLCGLAKGWAIDEISRCLQEEGFDSSYVDWGGDIKVRGQHPAGREWNVAVLVPPEIQDIGTEEKDPKHIAHISLRDGQSIATSGDYQQTLATRLSHILDPKVGAPIRITDDTCSSASVVNSSCMVADALATAAMACGTVGKGRALLDTFRGGSLKDPVDDYLLYSRRGPRVVRMRRRGVEDPKHREDRMSRHEPAHIVIVGGGLAGVSAAIEAANARATVTLLEKESDLGGNSAKATSGINACSTRVQYSQGIDDDRRFFERDTHVSAVGGNSDIGCVTMLSEKSSDAIHWLMDDLGVPLTSLSQLGGHAKKRTHRVPPRDDGTPVPVGFTIMQHAKAVAQSNDAITVRTGCILTKLLESDDNQEVVGVEYQDGTGKTEKLMCDAVVLATGGFGFDKSQDSLMAEHRPDLVGVPTTNGAFTTGDGIRCGEDIGANLIDMDKVQLHPTAFIDPKDPGCHTKYLGPEALRGSGGILLDQNGQRFINELDLRSVVAQKILDHCEPWNTQGCEFKRPWAWCVLNDEAQEKFGRPMLSFYKDQIGLFEAAEGTKGLADKIGCKEENVVNTLREYRQAWDTKLCQKTGKGVFPCKMGETDKSFILSRITPCIHYCMGGLEISSCGEVLTSVVEDTADSAKRGSGWWRGAAPRGSRKSAARIGGGLPKDQTEKSAFVRRAKIRRLFAAGEVTGGVHGGNRLGGNSLLECVVFGRLAGERAATVKQMSPGLLNANDWVPVVLREVKNTDAKYGHNTRVYRFNLHGALQSTGLDVGQFISIRGELDGDTLTGYYSPVSRNDDEGIIDILCRTDDNGGPIVKLLLTLRPGNSCEMKGMGGPRLIPQPTATGSVPTWLYNARKVKKISLLSGGTGLAPAIQITRAYMAALGNIKDLGSVEKGELGGGVKLVYAAEAEGDLAFVAALADLKSKCPGHLDYYLVLNSPPSGWTQGVGFVDADCIRQRLWFPPAEDHLLVMCGPPIFEKIMCATLSKLGYPKEQYYSFAESA